MNNTSAIETATERQTPSLNVRQKILLAAAELAARYEGDEAFSATELVVRAWQRHPESFSLEGTSHPDSNRVLVRLSGADGLIGLGWLTRVAPARYSLTRKGAAEAQRLLPLVPVAPRAPVPKLRAPNPPKIPESSPSSAEAATVRFVADLAAGDALRKLLRGSPLTELDARRFWGIKHLTEADARIAETERHLKRAVASFSSDRPGIPGLPPLSTCFGLLNLHRLMSARFLASPVVGEGGAS